MTRPRCVTPAGVPRSRAKLTRRMRRAGYTSVADARKIVRGWWNQIDWSATPHGWLTDRFRASVDENMAKL